MAEIYVQAPGDEGSVPVNLPVWEGVVPRVSADEPAQGEPPAGQGEPVPEIIAEEPAPAPEPAPAEPQAVPAELEMMDKARAGDLEGMRDGWVEQLGSETNRPE